MERRSSEDGRRFFFSGSDYFLIDEAGVQVSNLSPRKDWATPTPAPSRAIKASRISAKGLTRRDPEEAPVRL